MNRIFKSIKNSMSYHRACKLNNSKRYDEALEALSRISTDNKEYRAKIMLFTADILYLKKKFPEAEMKYSEFLSITQQGIEKMKLGDLEYLVSYAEYFRDQVRRAQDRQHVLTVPMNKHISLSSKASYLTKSEFMPLE